LKDSETLCPGANHSGDTCMDIEIINNTAAVNNYIF
jgi:hypothetical protein